MVSNISLTSSMRQNLLSLQKTQGLMDMTQNRLSTGKKVNTALDNPVNYFTAAALSDRASDLDTLLDSMGQAIQTLTAADNGIREILSVVQVAKSQATAARETKNIASTMKSNKVAYEAPVSSDYATSSMFAAAASVYSAKMSAMTGSLSIRLGDADKIKGSGNEFQIDSKVGKAIDDFTVTLSDGSTFTVAAITLTAAKKLDMEDYLNDIQNKSGGRVSARVIDGQLQIKSSDSTPINITSSGQALEQLGIQGPIVISSISAASDMKGLVENVNQALFDNGVTGLKAMYDMDSQSLMLKANDGSAIVLSGSFAEKTFGADSAIALIASVDGQNNRASYAENYTNALQQINQIVNNRDAGYKGINLIGGDSLTVNFNESRTSSINIVGTYLDAKGVGLTAAENDWRTDKDIDKSIGQAEKAKSFLQAQASTFAQNLSIVQIRQDFTKEMIETLTTGSDKLTLADMNEEGVNLLALQTRQQLGVNSLSMASQSAQAVLRLF